MHIIKIWDLVAQALKTSASVREVGGSIPGSVKSNTSVVNGSPP